MVVAFPNIKPAERSYTAPTYAITSVKAQSGVTSKRLWGTLPGDAKMTLLFRHVTTDTAALFVNAWNATKGGIDTLTIPANVLSGAGATLSAIMIPANNSIVWTFAQPPVVDFVGPAWANVQVELIGELRAA